MRDGELERLRRENRRLCWALGVLLVAGSLQWALQWL